MSRVITLAILLIALVVIAACGGISSPVFLTATPTSPQSTEFSPTATWLPPEPSPVIQTSTATALPVLAPTLTPAVEETLPFEFPDPAQFGWQLKTGGLNSPIGLANAGDSSDRLFIIEQSGKILVIDAEELVDEPYLDIRGRVSCCGERGLLGLAFHPLYPENGYIFVNYTDTNGDTVISRFRVSNDPDVADPASEVKLLYVEQPYANHNGGGLTFGPDGYLYIALGDGGSGGDPQGYAQNTDSLLGKLLRLDVDQPDAYAIPPENPFIGGGGAPEVWAYGLRNPWRFSFDRLTGDLFIGDVGQGSWEEIDFLPAGYPGGANFGWNYREGSHPYVGDASSNDLELIDPAAEYGRDQGFSVIGGMVYRGEMLSMWNGVYFYGDYGSGNIWGLYQSQDGSWQNRLLFLTGSNITSFGADESGELYYVAQDGSLYQFASK